MTIVRGLNTADPCGARGRRGGVRWFSATVRRVRAAPDYRTGPSHLGPRTGPSHFGPDHRPPAPSLRRTVSGQCTATAPYRSSAPRARKPARRSSLSTCSQVAKSRAQNRAASLTVMRRSGASSNSSRIRCTSLRKSCAGIGFRTPNPESQIPEVAPACGV